MENNICHSASIFCWTKIGAEAGQHLDAILRRKEYERVSGNGFFAWGIGNSLGKELCYDNMNIVFTTMKSKYRSIDLAPVSILLWLSYITKSGNVEKLPENVLLTSGGGYAGKPKKNHYALFCHSASQLSLLKKDAINVSYLRNLKTLKRVGPSQVTAVVCQNEKFYSGRDCFYDVAFRAKFVRGGFVQLANPVVLNEDLLNIYRYVESAQTHAEWRNGMIELKKKAHQEGAKTKSKGVHGEHLSLW